MSKRPLAIFTIIFGLGIVFGSYISLGFWPVYFLVLVLLIFVISCPRRTIFLSVVFCLGILWTVNSQQLPKDHISNYVLSGKSSCIVKGFITDEPASFGTRVRFLFRVKEIGFGNKRLSCSGDVIVYAKDKTGLRYGDALILKGILYRKERFLQLKIDESSSLVKTGSNAGNSLIKFSLGLKEKIRGEIYEYLSGVHAAILSAMILGDKRDIPFLVYRLMVRTGTVHILVVSGFNVGIVTFVVLLLLKILRIPRKVRFCIAAGFIVLYCLVTGATNPVARATIMSLVFLFAYLVRRDTDIYNSCALAGLCILVINPRQLFDVGFQLSFASVLSIAYLYPRLKTAIHLEALKIKALEYLSEGLLVSFSAWLGTAGIIAYNFRIFSPVTILANLFVVPLAALITLSGFSLVLLAPALPKIACLIGAFSKFASSLMLYINLAFIKIPYSSITY